MPRAEPVVDAVGEVGDAVADERRPPGAGPAEVLEPLLGLLEGGDRRLRSRPDRRASWRSCSRPERTSRDDALHVAAPTAGGAAALAGVDDLARRGG